MFVSLHELKREWVVQLFVNCMSTHTFPFFLLVSPIISVNIYIYLYIYIYIYLFIYIYIYIYVYIYIFMCVLDTKHCSRCRSKQGPMQLMQFGEV